MRMRFIAIWIHTFYSVVAGERGSRELDLSWVSHCDDGGGGDLRDDNSLHGRATYQFRQLYEVHDLCGILKGGRLISNEVIHSTIHNYPRTKIAGVVAPDGVLEVVGIAIGLYPRARVILQVIGVLKVDDKLSFVWVIDGHFGDFIPLFSLYGDELDLFHGVMMAHHI